MFRLRSIFNHEIYQPLNEIFKSQRSIYHTVVNCLDSHIFSFSVFYYSVCHASGYAILKIETRHSKSGDDKDSEKVLDKYFVRIHNNLA